MCACVCVCVCVYVCECVCVIKTTCLFFVSELINKLQGYVYVLKSSSPFVTIEKNEIIFGFVARFIRYYQSLDAHLCFLFKVEWTLFFHPLSDKPVTISSIDLDM